MGESVFEVVKQSVTAREAAELYGIAVGRGGMACCPFHDDRCCFSRKMKKFCI